jgi:hypothetical protein
VVDFYSHGKAPKAKPLPILKAVHRLVCRAAS